MHIGIIGVGFVGGTILKALENAGLHPRLFDKKIEGSTLENILGTEVCFVCLPSPTIDGKQDLSAYRDVLLALDDVHYSGIVCVKGTVLPGTMDGFREYYPMIKFTHSPEFLRERCAFEDFMSQKTILISGLTQYVRPVRHAYDAMFLCEACDKKPAYIISSNFKVTELAKYYHNTFLALKVSFANEIFRVCEDLDVSYGAVKDAAVSQGGLGESHVNVPGLASKLGYSGSCFPKDVNAFLKFAANRNIKLPILAAAKIQNDILTK